MASRADEAGERMVAAVEAIYDAAPDPAQWPHALQKIADCLEDVGAILLWRRDDGSFGTIVSDSLLEVQHDYEQGGWAETDLRALRVVERGYFFSGDPFADRHLCSAEEIRTDPIYAQFNARHGLGHVGAVAVSPDPHVGVALGIQRNARMKQPFSEAELQLVGRLGRHVEKSLRLSIRLFDAELTNLGLGEALLRVGIAVFALDSLGRVVFSNPVAERLVGAQIEIESGRLRLGSSEERAATDAAIMQMLRGEPVDLTSEPKPILLQRPPPDRPLVVYLLPITPRESLAEQFLTHSRCIVLVVDPQASDPVDPSVVRDVLGVTLGEARVAALVATGLSPRDAAKHLGIMEGTARTVLKRVYGKVGVSRQSELTALLARAVLPAHTI